MKKQTYLLNTLLAAVLGVALLVAVLVRTFAPIVILPKLDIPNMVLLSLAALLADSKIAFNSFNASCSASIAFPNLSFSSLEREAFSNKAFLNSILASIAVFSI